MSSIEEILGGIGEHLESIYHVYLVGDYSQSRLEISRYTGGATYDFIIRIDRGMVKVLTNPEGDLVRFELADPDLFDKIEAWLRERC